MPLGSKKTILISIFLLVLVALAIFFFSLTPSTNPDKEKIIQLILADQTKEGGFNYSGQMYYTVLVMKKLNSTDRIKTQFINFINSKKNSDGGYGFSGESNLLDTFFSLATLDELDSFSQANANADISFLNKDVSFIYSPVYALIYDGLGKTMDESTKQKIIAYNMNLYENDHFRAVDVEWRYREIVSTYMSVFSLDSLGAMNNVNKNAITNFMRASLNCSVSTSCARDTFYIIQYLKQFDQYTDADKNIVKNKGFCKVENNVFCIESQCDLTTQLFCLEFTM
jgi:hypothetical protein